MKRVLLACAIMAAPILAQEAQIAPTRFSPLVKTEQDNQEVQVLVKLKYAEPRAVARLLGNFNVHINVDEQMKVLALTGRAANVTTAEEAIKQLDVPAAEQKDIDLMVYFVVGSDNATQVGTAIPADLQSTVATLKSTFPYKNYGLLDALSLRTRAGVMASTNGQLSQGRLTTFRVNSASLEGDGTMIQLNNLHAGLRVPNGLDKNGGANYMETGITTEMVDIKEGQKLVVGRSSLNGPDTALFLVLIAKVAQ